MSESLASSTPQAGASVGLRQAVGFWLKLGLISFGGPAGQISIMHQELVERRGWISERRFLHALNYCMLLPGPEAQQLATYIGWLLHRSWGGIIAGVLFVLPSLFVLIALSWVYIAFGEQPVVAGIFYGIKPAVTAIVLQAALRIGGRTLKSPWLWAIAGAAFVAIFALNVPFPLIVAGAALAGWLGGRLVPQHFSGGGHGHPDADDEPEVAHASEHTRFRWSGLLRVLLVGALLWLAPMGLLTALYGWDGTYTQMAWFFTKAALLTFGGAYAVLPYVYQGAVTHYGWLSPTQMIDGLALGEATPGPLIMVVAFVAFVGAYLQPPLGGDQAFASGALAACLVTWFTFLPSFLFILGGAPLVEATHGKLHFTAPLTGITAAVVGVIVNLAVFFAWHTFWPEGASGSIEWPALAIALLAAVALLRFKVGVIRVLLASALAGLAISFW